MNVFFMQIAQKKKEHGRHMWHDVQSQESWRVRNNNKETQILLLSTHLQELQTRLLPQNEAKAVLIGYKSLLLHVVGRDQTKKSK